jgi:hypothetical protein
MATTRGTEYTVYGTCPACKGHAMVRHWGSMSKWIRVMCEKCPAIWVKKGDDGSSSCLDPPAGTTGSSSAKTRR